MISIHWASVCNCKYTSVVKNAMIVSKALFIRNVWVCFCITLQEWFLRQQVMVFTLNVCIFKNCSAKIQEKRKRRRYVWIDLKLVLPEWNGELTSWSVEERLYSPPVSLPSVRIHPVLQDVACFWRQSVRPFFLALCEVTQMICSLIHSSVMHGETFLATTIIRVNWKDRFPKN